MEKMHFLNTPDSSHPFVVVYKPAGIPSAPLTDGEFSALTFAMENFPQIKKVKGRKEIEYGLVHRIDTETSGLVLVALDQEFYDFIQKEQCEGRFEKWYRAKVQVMPKLSEKMAGFPDNGNILEELLSKKEVEVRSAFRKFGQKGKEVRPVVEGSGKAAEKKSGNREYFTKIQLTEQNFIHAHIVSGFRHQVRCHLAWCGLPIVGDKIYNPNFREASSSERMQFEAFRLCFNNPRTNKSEVFEI
ncbi:MAG: RNA pseudouridine synthase [Treponema sp.]|nr:RNA pseudouridine synthase [Candidatus Treponema equifaecale]